MEAKMYQIAYGMIIRKRLEVGEVNELDFKTTDDRTDVKEKVIPTKLQLKTAEKMEGRVS